VVQVHCDEGIANHIDPEPCAGKDKAVARLLATLYPSCRASPVDVAQALRYE
jgi:hypothetical protein